MSSTPPLTELRSVFEHVINQNRTVGIVFMQVVIHKVEALTAKIGVGARFTFLLTDHVPDYLGETVRKPDTLYFFIYHVHSTDGEIQTPRGLFGVSLSELQVYDLSGHLPTLH